jgi:hypothetical protein
VDRGADKGGAPAIQQWSPKWVASTLRGARDVPRGRGKKIKHLARMGEESK